MQYAYRFALLSSRCRGACAGIRKDTGSVTRLEKTIADLKLELNDREQENLSTDIEVAGIPEESNERSVHIILNLATKLGVALEERDIVSAEQDGPERRGNVQDGGAASSI